MESVEKDACVRVCGVSSLSIVMQLVCVVVLFVGSFFAVGFALELVKFADVSSIPPGLLHG